MKQNMNQDTGSGEIGTDNDADRWSGERFQTLTSQKRHTVRHTKEREKPEQRKTDTASGKEGGETKRSKACAGCPLWAFGRLTGP